MISWVVFGLCVAVVVLTSLFKDVNWSVKTKNMIAGGLSIVAAAITAAIAHHGNFTSLDFLALSTEIYGGSQLVYHFIFKDTQVEGALANVNSKATDEVEQVNDIDGTQATPARTRKRAS